LPAVLPARNGSVAFRNGNERVGGDVHGPLFHRYFSVVFAPYLQFVGLKQINRGSRAPCSWFF
jgi:hypothetical protein